MTITEIISQLVPGLALVLAIPGAVWWWSRRGGGNGGPRLRVTERTAFGKNAWVAVVEVSGRRFLVGAGESGVNLISELEPSADPVGEALDDPASVEGTTDLTATRAALAAMHERPRMGLVRRLQQMTLRTAVTPSGRPTRARLR